MGMNTWSDIVSNVAYLGNVKDIKSVMETIECEEEDYPLMINGWTIHCWSKNDPMQGKKKSLYTNKVSKENKVCHLLNVSPYAHVCEYEFVVFGDDRSAVEMFLKDFNRSDVQIDDMDSVCQTL